MEKEFKTKNWKKEFIEEEERRAGKEFNEVVGTQDNQNTTTNKEFNLSEKIRELELRFMNDEISPLVFINRRNDLDKEFIKRNIGCGIDIGGIPCGDNVGEEDNFKSYYCDRCRKLIKEAGDKFKD